MGLSKDVKLQVRSVYGKERIYPVSDAAQWLLKLTGRATFNRKDVEVMECMGFKIEFVPVEPSGREE